MDKRIYLCIYIYIYHVEPPIKKQKLQNSLFFKQTNVARIEMSLEVHVLVKKKKKTSAVCIGRVCSSSHRGKKICTQIFFFFFGYHVVCSYLLRKNSSLIRLYGQMNVCKWCFALFFFALSWSEYIGPITSTIICTEEKELCEWFMIAVWIVILILIFFFAPFCVHVLWMIVRACVRSSARAQFYWYSVYRVCR